MIYDENTIIYCVIDKYNHATITNILKASIIHRNNINNNDITIRIKRNSCDKYCRRNDIQEVANDILGISII